MLSLNLSKAVEDLTCLFYMIIEKKASWSSFLCELRFHLHSPIQPCWKQTIILESSTLSSSSSSITSSAVGCGSWACRCNTSYEQGQERKGNICEDASIFHYYFSINVSKMSAHAHPFLLSYVSQQSDVSLFLCLFGIHQLEVFLCSVFNSALACSICPPLCLALDFLTYFSVIVSCPFHPRSPL